FTLTMMFMVLSQISPQAHPVKSTSVSSSKSLQRSSHLRVHCHPSRLMQLERSLVSGKKPATRLQYRAALPHLWSTQAVAASAQESETAQERRNPANDAQSAHHRSQSWRETPHSSRR